MSDQQPPVGDAGPDPRDTPANPYGAPPAPPYQQQPPQAPYGQEPAGQNPYGQNPYGQNPYGQNPYGQPAPQGTYPPGYAPGGVVDPDRRPGAVTWAGVLTITASVLAMLLFGLFSLLLAVDSGREDFIDGVTSDGDFTRSDAATVANVFLVVCLVVAALALLGIVMGALLFRRSAGARTTVIVLSVVTIVLSLPGLLAYGLGLLTGGAAVATLVLLLQGRSKDWFARRPPDGAGLPLGTTQPWG